MIPLYVKFDITDVPLQKIADRLKEDQICFVTIRESKYAYAAFDDEPQLHIFLESINPITQWELLTEQQIRPIFDVSKVKNQQDYTFWGNISLLSFSPF